MGIRFSGMVLAVVTTAFVIAPASSTLAQFGMPGGGGLTTGDRMGGGGGGKGATQRATNLNSSRSNVPCNSSIWFPIQLPSNVDNSVDETTCRMSTRECDFVGGKFWRIAARYG